MILSNSGGRMARLSANNQQPLTNRRLASVAARLAAPRRADSPTAGGPAAAAAAAAAAASPAGAAAAASPAPAASAAAAAATAPLAAPAAAATPAATPATPTTDTSGEPKAGWWTKKPTKGTLIEIGSAQELVDLLADAGDRLVVVDVLASWCGACRGVFPKVLQLVEQYAGEGPPDPTAPGNAPEDAVIFCKLNFDDNRRLAKTMGVRVLPYFMFFRGAEGRVAAFSCTTSKIARLRDALDFFSAGVCSLEPNPEVQEISRGWDIHPSHPLDATRVEHFWDLDEATPAEQSLAAAE